MASETLDAIISGLSGPQLDLFVRSEPFWQSYAGLSWRRRTVVLLLLCRERVSDLSLAARVRLIVGLQHGPTPEPAEIAIRDLLLATEGPDLTNLKRRIDGQGDYHDLVQLLYHDVDKVWIRKQILTHFADQARLYPCPEVRVLSDLDDTFYRNWCDPRFPTGVVYPGVLQLFHELDFPEEGSEPGDIVFLTGRVGERSGYLENRYRKQLTALGAQNFTMLTGSLVHQFVWPWVLHRKWYNFERHRLVFPEMGVVMFGDTGQADPEFLSRARERYPSEVRAALLHAVVPIAPERRRRCEQLGVLFYETYLGAAVHLYLAGTLSCAGVSRVAIAAAAELDRVAFPSQAVRQARTAELERDVRWAKDVCLPEEVPSRDSKP